ncbi:polyketide synthase [Apiospora kogelbergensis]|uniref:Polyketide synthase n=1 Tax=Apiospora kogelbergensis TaxID=1337665 RepID=A0AAW0RDU2_9PEZI
MSYHQMAACVEDLVSQLPSGQGPLRILEIGAGTGGTTLYMAPLLERLGVDVEYTFANISPSMVTAARKKFKRYPFMKYLAHDIEKPVPVELLGTQHIVFTSNAVHATHELVKSGVNIRNALRPDGFLMMLEMTKIVPFVDIIFGLLEGWWLFDDGRKHAIISPNEWETALHSAGFGHVDWSDGNHAENKIQKVIIAMASGPTHDRLPMPNCAKPTAAETYPDLATRERDISAYVQKYSAGFEAPTGPAVDSVIAQGDVKQCILITGATGSLGTHLVKEFSEREDVEAVICINRRGDGSTPTARQMKALAFRGVVIDEEARSKLRIIETDSHRPNLGLGEDEGSGRSFRPSATSSISHGKSQPIYHIDNPVQQPWRAMSLTLTRDLDLGGSAIALVPFDEWVARVRRSPLAPDTDNPAARLVDFLDGHFRRMSCGGLVLDTAKACRDSAALAVVGPVSDEVARRYVAAWRDAGFLH